MTDPVPLLVDRALIERIQRAASSRGIAPQELANRVLAEALDREEAAVAGDTHQERGDDASAAWSALAGSIHWQSTLRSRITDACRLPEPEALKPLLVEAAVAPTEAAAIAARARQLVTDLRRKLNENSGGVESLIHEYSLSSQEGVALMCLAEALLRIPDSATRDALIRDKIAQGNWHAHLGQSRSLFVNAATWGLLITGRLTSTASEQSLASALARLIGRGGEPLIRRGVDLTMRLMGKQFVCGQTIEEALENARPAESRGFTYSFDMLGEAAATAQDAERYHRQYESAIHAIGRAAKGRSIYEGPGISIKLSALHPRYSRAQFDRVMGELLPRVMSLALLARQYGIGLNIDAEESDRLEISLDLFEHLCLAPELSGWNGLGFVVQAYQKRAPFVIDWLVDLASRSNRRLMVRLVKGAYWDGEIKRAQVDGLTDFPVYTRKPHTDVSYLACARRLLRAPQAVFAQFATHNAQTVASIIEMAGPGSFQQGQYEFQCLHGMGEPLYDEVVGKDKLDRPCRIYAPVGTHETLLAYLVRRLLENGANTSFVNRIADNQVAIDDLIIDPVTHTLATNPALEPHARISLPPDLFRPERRNSAGMDLASERQLASLASALQTAARITPEARPLIAQWSAGADALRRPLPNPADHRQIVGSVVETSAAAADAALTAAVTAQAQWGGLAAPVRASLLERAADLYESHAAELMDLIVREAGRTLPNAQSELREAVDFLRYYAAQMHFTTARGQRPLGTVVAISPWNFPLAIFTGQIAAALVAGNCVLAKPAEQTPLVATRAVSLLHEAGIPAAVLQLTPGGGAVGAALVADARIAGVLFTGSTAVARRIQQQLATRLGADGAPIPFIAETGGLNAMIVDSSALAEQVVADALMSAFDSAGQRCSALRLLCLQEDIADHVLEVLRGAMRELRVGDPALLQTDVGPVISAEARAGILSHIDGMRAAGCRITQLDIGRAQQFGTFVGPTIVELAHVGQLRREIFGPVLHVVRYQRNDLPDLIDAINAAGYGLTFGLHTRIDETIATVVDRIAVGNVYINRNIVGAVVGVQPFGGRGLSGTGPKAGGPLYVGRLMQGNFDSGMRATLPAPAAQALLQHWVSQGAEVPARRLRQYLEASALGATRDLPGPVGERNTHTLVARGRVLGIAQTSDGALLQIAAALATGNSVVIRGPASLMPLLRSLPADLEVQVAAEATTSTGFAGFDAVLHEGQRSELQSLLLQLAQEDGPLTPVLSATPEGLASGREDYALIRLLRELVITTNTAAAGGNASLMSIG